MIRGALALAAGIALVALVVFCLWAVKLYRIPSSAMEPTLHCARPALGCRAGRADRVVAIRLVGPFGRIHRGDVVFFHSPPLAVQRCGASGVYVKRVDGLPGERWHGRNVPPGSYVLLGDNRRASCDSRVFGPVPRGRLIAKLEAVYWPPNRLGLR